MNLELLSPREWVHHHFHRQLIAATAQTEKTPTRGSLADGQATEIALAGVCSWEQFVSLVQDNLVALNLANMRTAM